MIYVLNNIDNKVVGGRELESPTSTMSTYKLFPFLARKAGRLAVFLASVIKLSIPQKTNNSTHNRDIELVGGSHA